MKKNAIAKKTLDYKDLENEMEKLEKEANEINSTLLHIAVANNKKNLVVKLLESGDWSANIEDDENNALIHTAAGVNNLDLLKLLVQHGADVNNTNDDNWTVLHSAAWGIINNEKADWEIIRWLLKQKGIEGKARNKREISVRDVFLQKSHSYAEIYDNFLESKIKVINFFQEQIGSINGCDYSSINTERGKNEKFLDTLARLLTGNETCVAVCYHQEKLFIASNRGKVEYAKEYLGKLRDFFKDNSFESYKKLVEIAIEQTYFECLKSSNSWWLWPEGEKRYLKEFRKAIISYKRNISLELEELQEIAEELHKEVISLKQDNKSSEANKKWDYLVHWHDAGEIISMVMKGGLEEAIVDAIRNGYTKYIEVKGKQKSKLHAEMKIVEEICKTREKVETYIGLTKSACVDCYSVIELLNNDGYELNVCGTHGQGYQWWIAPGITRTKKKEFKKNRNENKLKFRLTKKKTTSKIPSKLNDVAQLLRDFQSQKQQAQIQVPPKKTSF
jgi:hypothetical protein